MGPSRRRTPRSGKPAASEGRQRVERGEHCNVRRHAGEYRRRALAGADSAWWTVRKMQLKLHRWASEDPARRFDDLRNLVYDLFQGLKSSAHPATGIRAGTEHDALGDPSWTAWQRVTGGGWARSDRRRPCGHGDRRGRGMPRRSTPRSAPPPASARAGP